MYTISNLEINNAEIKLGPNGYFELYVESDQPLPKVKVSEVYANSGAHFFFGEDNGYVNFYITHDDDTEHGPDYRWSSRPAVFRNLGYDCVGHTCLKEGHGWKFGIDLTPEKMIEILSDLGYGLVSKYDYRDFTEAELVIVNKQMLRQMRLKYGRWDRTQIGSIYLEPRI